MTNEERQEFDAEIEAWKRELADRFGRGRTKTVNSLELALSLLLAGFVAGLWVGGNKPVAVQSAEPDPQVGYRVETQGATVSGPFLDALVQIESDGRNNVPGDNGLAIGVLQLQPIYVREANRLVGRDVFRMVDRTDREKARKMVQVVLSYWAGFHAERGRHIGYDELCSLHRQPSHKWKPSNLNSKLERGRTAKLHRLMGDTI